MAGRTEAAHGSETRTNSKSTKNDNLDAQYKTIFHLGIIWHFGKCQPVERSFCFAAIALVTLFKFVFVHSPSCQCCAHYINLYIVASHTNCVVTVHHHDRDYCPD